MFKTIDKNRRTFRTVVEAGDAEQELLVTYRHIPAERATLTYPGSEASIDFERVERYVGPGEFWDDRVTRDYWANVTDAEWDRLTDEAWADFYAD